MKRYARVSALGAMVALSASTAWLTSADAAPTPSPPGLSESQRVMALNVASKFMRASGPVRVVKAKGVDVAAAYFPDEKIFGDAQGEIDRDDLLVIHMTGDLSVKGAFSTLTNGVLPSGGPQAMVQIVDERTGQSVATWAMFTPAQLAQGEPAKVVDVANRPGSATGGAVIVQVDFVKP